MKRFTFLATALASLFLAASCQQENLEPVAQGTAVKFQVEVPGGMDTKAIADASEINVVHYEIYKVEHAVTDDADYTYSNGVALAKGHVEVSNKTADMTFDLLADQKYVAIFWAQQTDDAATGANDYYEIDDLREISLKDAAKTTGNAESRAAFFRTYMFSTETVQDHKVTLYRPFAQLNLGTTKESLEPEQTGEETNGGYSIVLDKSQVLVTGLATKFNTIAGIENLTIENNDDVHCGEAVLASTTTYAFDFESADVPSKNFENKFLQVTDKNGVTTDYMYVAMNYFFATNNVTVEYNIVTDKGTVNNTVTNVPVGENFRTNIIGNLLTSKTDFEIVIDEDFNKNDINGPEFVQEPKKDSEGNYVITNNYELLWLAAAVNGTLPPMTKAEPSGKNFAGETFKLSADIDLQNMDWTPIGANGTVFMGTFDGNEKTISNLKVSTEGRASAGLFAAARNVKNLTVKDAVIEGHYKTGVIVGDGLCARIENCHVDGAVIVSTPYNNDDANHVGAIVGYLSAEPVAYVKGCSVKNATITGYRDVAGIAGTANGASVVTGNSVENVTVTSDQTVEYVDNTKDGNAGAVVGRIHANATVEPNTVGENVVVVRKVDTTKELEYAVAEAQSGDTIYVGAEVTMPYFAGKALNFEGLTKSAVVKQSPATHIDEFYAGAELNFKGLTLVGTEYLNNTQGYQKAVKETYTECNFQDYIMFAGDETIINKCNFTSNVGQYFWTGTADVITFNECKFDVLERAIKVCTVGNNGEREVNINNCQFKAATQKKAAIEIDGTKGSSYVVNINSCTETGFAKGEFTDLAMFNVEGADNVQVYLDGAKWFRNGVMEENGELFAYNAAGLQYLLDNAVDGETVKVGADIEGDVTVTQKADVKIAIEGNNHKYAGVITVDGKSATYKTAGVTIKNLNFEAETISADACIRLGISGNNNTRYTCNVAVEGCNFAVPGAVAVKSYTGGDHNLSIKKCTGEGIHSLTQLANVTGVTIEEVNITGGRGASFGQSSNIVVKNSTFVAESYGLRVDAKSEAVLAIENVNITAKLPVVARKTSKNYTINFTGVNNLVADGYQVVFTTGDDEAAFVAPAEYTLTGAEGFKVFPRDADTYNYVYNADELQAAIDAGKKSIILQPGKYEKTINLKDDVTIEGLEGAIVNCMNLNGADDVTLKNIAFDAAGAQMAYDGKGNQRFMANIMSGDASKNGKGTRGLVVEGCTFTGTFANGGTVIAFNDQGRGTGQSGDITIKGCTFATEGAYVDIYTYYSGYGQFIIENNIFNSTVVDRPIYLGRYQSSTPVVVKGNAFNKCADFNAATYIQAHSGAYTVSFDGSGNTFAD